MAIIITRQEFERIFGDYDPKLKESLWKYFQNNYREMMKEKENENNSR